MNVDELKDVMLEGFRRIDSRFDDVDRRVDDLRVELKKDVNLAHVRFERIIDLLKYVKDGESPELVQRVSALEFRVSTLEKKKR